MLWFLIVPICLAHGMLAWYSERFLLPQRLRGLESLPWEDEEQRALAMQMLDLQVNRWSEREGVDFIRPGRSWLHIFFLQFCTLAAVLATVVLHTLFMQFGDWSQFLPTLLFLACVNLWITLPWAGQQIVHAIRLRHPAQVTYNPGSGCLVLQGEEIPLGTVSHVGMAAYDCGEKGYLELFLHTKAGSRRALITSELFSLRAPFSETSLPASLGDNESLMRSVASRLEAQVGIPVHSSLDWRAAPSWGDRINWHYIFFWGGLALFILWLLLGGG